MKKLKLLLGVLGGIFVTSVASLIAVFAAFTVTTQNSFYVSYQATASEAILENGLVIGDKLGVMNYDADNIWSSTQDATIQSITFDTYNDRYLSMILDSVYSVSVADDGSDDIMMYKIPSTTEGMYDCYILSDGTIKPNSSLKAMFMNLTALKTITFTNFSNLDSSLMPVTNYMFANCSSLEAVDLSWIGANAQILNMEYMFANCSSLTSIDTSTFSVAMTLSVNSMFEGCSSLTSLDLGNINTSMAPSLASMFKGCSNLETVKWLGLESSNVVDTSYMFGDCTKLTAIILNQFDTSKVKDMSHMFSGCASLEEINLMGFNTGQVTDMSSMFKGCEKLTNLDISTFNTSKVTSMKSMFEGCVSLISLNLSGLNTKSVTDMGSIFKGCEDLTSLNITGIDTSNVKGMTSMFSGCSSLTTLDLTNFSTDKAMDMSYMFEGAGLTSINVKNFNTGNVKNMEGMFKDTVAETLDVSRFDTSRVTNMALMFKGNTGLTNLDLIDFDTTNVTTMRSMFENCTNLEILNIYGFNTKNVTDMTNMFAGATDLNKIYVSANWTTFSALDNSGMFTNCIALVGANGTAYNGEYTDATYAVIDKAGTPGYLSSLLFLLGGEGIAVALGFAELNLLDPTNSTFEQQAVGLVIDRYSDMYAPVVENCTASYPVSADGSNSIMLYIVPSSQAEGFNEWYILANDTIYANKNSTYLFAGFAAMQVYYFNNFNTKYTTDMSYMFAGNIYLPTLDLTGWDTGRVTTMEGMFAYCQTLNNPSINMLDTSNVTNMNGTFAYTSGMSTLDISNWDTGKVTSMEVLFAGTGLTSLNLDNFDTSNVASMVMMFSGCEELEELDLSSFDTSKVTNMGYMFEICKQLSSLNLTGWDTSNVTDMCSMFAGCAGLTSLNVSNFDTSNVTTMYDMFGGCQALTSLDLSNFDTSNVIDMSNMFSGCYALTSLDLSSFDTSKVTDMRHMFMSNQMLTTIYVSSLWTTKSLTSGGGMFQSCHALVGGNGTAFNSSYTDATYAVIDTPTTPGYLTTKFPRLENGLKIAESLGTISPSNILNVTFDYNSKNYKSIIQNSVYSTAVVSDETNDIMLYVTESSTSGYYDVYILSYFGIYANEDSSYLFSGLTNLAEINFKNFDTQHATNTSYMFYNLSAIEELDLTTFNTANVTDMTSMFEGCSSLKTISVISSNWSTASVTASTNMFNGCTSIVGGNGTTYDSTKVDATYARVDTTDNAGYFSSIAVLKDAFKVIENLGGKPSTIKTITFDYLSESYATLVSGSAHSVAVDVGGTGDIMLYLVASTTQSGYYDCYILSNYSIYTNKNCSSLFSMLRSLTEITFSNFNTRNATDMSNMFSSCNKLTTLDLSSFNTSNVTDMGYMFDDCSGLTSLNVSSFNTSNVTDMGSMFYMCESLTELDLSNFDTSNVTNMSSMFQLLEQADYAMNYTTALTSLNISSFDTSKVTSMMNMFTGCNVLTNLDVSHFNTSNVMRMNDMFAGCTSLISLDLSNFNTSNVYDMSAMFAMCIGLTSLDISSFDTTNVQDMSMMFAYTIGLGSLDVTSFNTSDVTNMSAMFAMSIRSTLDLSSFDTSKVTDMSQMFAENMMLTTIYVSSLWSTESVTASDGMFAESTMLVGGNGTRCDGTNNIDATYARIDTSSTPGYFTKVTKLQNNIKIKDKLGNIPASSVISVTFDYAEDKYSSKISKSVRSLSLAQDGSNDIMMYIAPSSSADGYYEVYVLSNMTMYAGDDCSNMFAGLTNAQEITLTNFDTNKTTDMSYMFYNCGSLTTINVVLPLWSTDEVGLSTDMFGGCTSLVGGKGTAFTTLQVTDTTYAKVDATNSKGYLSGYAMIDNNTILALKIGMNMLDEASSLALQIMAVLFDYYDGSAFGDLFGAEISNRVIVDAFKTGMLGEYIEKPLLNNGSDAIMMYVGDVSMLLGESIPVLVCVVLSEYDMYLGRNASMMFMAMMSMQIALLSNFNTSKTTNMSRMFGMSGVSDLDLSGFDTSNVTDMTEMFTDCQNLSGVDLSSFDTSKVTNMSRMFYYCTDLANLNLSSFDTSNVTNMNAMFYSCGGLQTIYASAMWSTSSVTASDAMFDGCTSLVGENGTACDGTTNIDKTYARIDEENTPGYFSTKSSYIARGKLANFLGPINPALILTVTVDYYDSAYLKLVENSVYKLAVTSDGTKNIMLYVVESKTDGFYDIYILSHGKISAPANASYELADLTGLEEVYLYNYRTANTTNMSYMFSGCESLEKIVVDNTLWSTANVTNSTNMFAGCTSLVGGNGTTYDESHLDATYACPDTPTTPGYLTGIAVLMNGVRADSLGVVTADKILTATYDRFNETYNAIIANSAYSFACDVEGAGSATGDIMFYLVESTTTAGYYDAYILSYFDIYTNKNASYMFANATSLTAINFNNFNTKYATDMSSMFHDCHSLATLDVSGFNTSHVTNMSMMFAVGEDLSLNSHPLTTLDLSSFDTSNVTNMSGMFVGAIGLTSLDLSNFNTSKVTDMSMMFWMTGMTSLDLSNFNTSNVTNMQFMFAWNNLTEINVSSFDTSKVTNMGGMFWLCQTQTLDLSSFNTSNVTNMASMFNNCQALTTLDLSSFNTSNVTSMYNMFAYCYLLETIYVSQSWSTQALADGGDMFKDCTVLVGGNGTAFDISHIDATYARIDRPGEPGYFTNNALLVNDFVLSENIGPLSADKVLNVTFDFNNLSTNAKIKNAVYEKLISDSSSNNDINLYIVASDVSGYYDVIILSDALISTNTNASNMFNGLTGVKSISFNNFTTLKATDMKYMFYDCSALTTLNLTSFNTSNVTDMSYMFAGCTGLQIVNLTTFATSNVTNMASMFYNCSSLTTLNISLPNWSTVSVTESTNMFTGCAVIVGGNGTVYDNTHTDDEYGRIDTEETPGYGTGYATLANGFKVSENTGSISYTTILTVTFDYYNETYNQLIEGCAYSCSVVEDGSDAIKLYLVASTTTEGYYDCYILSSYDIYINKDAGGMFGLLDATTTITLNNFNTSLATNMSGMFSGCEVLTSLNGLNNFNTSGVTSMSYMFNDCKLLTSIDVTNFDTSGVTSMSSMFSDCNSLTSLDVTNFDTKVVTSMCYMFSDCELLTSLNVSNFDTSNVTDMSAMFFRCTALTSLNVSNFNTSNVTDMRNMFSNCDVLTSLNVSNFDTSNVTNMSGMFCSCDVLTSLNVSNFDTSNVTDMGDMFSGCHVLTSINGLTNFNTSKVTNMREMFSYCLALTSLDLTSFDTSNVTYMYSMFNFCCELTTIYVSSTWSTSANTNKSATVFDSCTKLVGGNGTTYSDSHIDATYARIDTVGAPGYFTAPPALLKSGFTVWGYRGGISDENILSVTFDYYGNVPSSVTTNYAYSEAVQADGSSEITIYYVESSTQSGYYDCYILSYALIKANTSCYGMFYSMDNLKTINFNNFDTSNVTNMYRMFCYCKSLTSLDLSSFNTSNVTNMSEMFRGCEVLTSLNGLNNFNTGGVTSMSYMFNDCKLLTSIDVTNFDTRNVTDMSDMFSACNALTSLDVSSFDTSNVTDMSYMFQLCLVLTSLDVSSFNTSNVTNMRSMFCYCNSLTSLDLSNFDTSNVTDMRDMFYRWFYTTSSGTIYDKLTSLDVSSFNTSNVTDMNSMFFGCNALTSLDLSNFDTSNVTDMNRMFYSCKALTSLDLSNFDTSNVTNMSYMFHMYYDGTTFSKLTSLDVSSFDTSKVTNMSGIFQYCTALTSLDLSSFNTSNVTNMSYMFNSCDGITSLDLSNFDTSKVTSMYRMFDCCYGITSLDLSSFNTSNVTDMRYMFSYCRALRTIYVSELWSTSAVTNGTEMFTNCNFLVGGNGTAYNSTYIDVTYARIDATGTPGYLTGIAYLENSLKVSENLGSISASNILTVTSGRASDYANVPTNSVHSVAVGENSSSSIMLYFVESTTASGFYDCYILSNLEIHANTDASYMFYGLTNAQEINLNNFYTEKVTNMSNMFAGLTNVQQINIQDFNTANVTDMSYMFYNNGSLTTITVSRPDWITTNVTNSENMFTNCISLVGEFGTEYKHWATDITYAKVSTNTTDGYLTGKAVKLINGIKVYNYVGVNQVGITLGHKSVLNITFDFNSDYYDTLLASPKYKTSIASDGSDDIMLYINQPDSSAGSYNLYILSDHIIATNTNASCLFKDLTGTKAITFNNFTTKYATDMNNMFYDCRSLENLDVSDFNTSNVTNMSYMFWSFGLGIGIVKATSISGLTSFDTSKVTNMSYMFANSRGLSILDLSSFDTSKVTNMQQMFNGILELTTIYVSSLWSTAALTSSGSMFFNCGALVGGNGTAYNSSYDDASYAKNDEEGSPGYFTEILRGGLLNGFSIKDHLGSITASQIKTVTFDSEPEKYADIISRRVHSTPVSAGGLKNIKLYLVPTEADATFYDCYILNNGTIYANISLSEMCRGLISLTEVNIYSLDTSRTKDMSYMFNAADLTSIRGLEGLNTSNVTNMSYMFQNVDLTSIDLSTWDTSKVTNMTYMFYSCQNLTSLNLSSNFNTTNVTDMSYMFGECKVLATINGISNLNTANVTNMRYMFGNCKVLASLDVTNFDTSNVTNMRYMFAGCAGLTSLDLSSFDTSNVTTMSGMFNDCSNLKTIYASSLWSTSCLNWSSQETFMYAFTGCTSLVGGNGTKYNSSHDSATYARIDTAETPGYFTYKEAPQSEE